MQGGQQRDPAVGLQPLDLREHGIPRIRGGHGAPQPALLEMWLQNNGVR
ncbi:MAG: hypothetical protein JWO98_5266 [Frankiales bacterium]|nr:hypothetical protein [Frankiales bacterium]